MKKVTGERIGAAIIDMIIVGIVSILISVLVLVPQGFEGAVDTLLGAGIDESLEPDSSYLMFLVISGVSELVLGVLYFVYVPYKMKGQTLGKNS